MSYALPPITVGWLIALLVLVVSIVFLVTHQLPLPVGGLLAALALARLV